MKLLEPETGFAETELKGFVECNKAFISVLMQKEPELDQSEKYKDDQKIFKENVKALEIAKNTKEKEILSAGFIDADIKPPPPMNGQLAELIESLNTSNKQNVDAIKALATTNADAVKV